jgi:multicomponent Na+:H+ antiporter subunit B
MPAFGDASAPAQLHVAPYYLQNAQAETGVPNVVTSILAAYRGFDTLGEVTVIFTAGMGVLVLLGGATKRRRKLADSSTDESPSEDST